MRFTTLLHYIYNVETLRMAWDRMRRLITRRLPMPTVGHPYPLRRIGVLT